MNAAERAVAWRRLRDAGIASGEPPVSDGHAPWYLRTMLAAAGLLAGVFGLVLIGLVLVPLFDGAAATFLAGALLCAGATALYRLPSASDFLPQIAFVTSVGGQAVVGVGLVEIVGDPLVGTGGIAWSSLMAGVALTMFLVVADPLHRLACAFLASACGGLLLSVCGLGALLVPLFAAGFAVVCLGERTRRGAHRPLDALGSAFALALALAPFVRPVASELSGLSPLVGTWVPTEAEGVLAGVVLGAIAWWVGDALGARTATRLAPVGAAFALGVLASGAPGIPAALIIVAVGFVTHRRVLVGLGLLTLLGYLFRFYHALDQTLLAKSVTLAASGAALIALGTVIGRLGRGRETRAGETPDA